ncbi:MAG: 3-methyl-2-oxobutanoate hydroxymethyltransferase [Bdellovibrionales bacterium]
MTIQDFVAKKQKQEKISMVTCYDFTFAKLINETPIDAILVGDSAAMVMHGQKTTLNISSEMMADHIRSVVAGAPRKLVIGDMPFLSYRKSLTSNMNSVEVMMKAGAQALKLEGARGHLKLVHHIVQSGVPVMGHLGLTPQSIHALGGFKVQGRDEKTHQMILDDALRLEEAGCFSLVLECVPSKLAQEISSRLHIPVIGIGAGAQVDGQVLVLHDLLGLNEGFKPTFLRQYLNGSELVKSALGKFHQDVVTKDFPSSKESYS